MIHAHMNMYTISALSPNKWGCSSAEQWVNKAAIVSNSMLCSGYYCVWIMLQHCHAGCYVSEYSYKCQAAC